MTTNHVHIRDTWEALHPSGGGPATMPGSFKDGGLVFAFPRVTTVNSRGKHMHWEVSVRLSLDGVGVPFDRKDMLAQPAPPLDRHVGVITTDSWQDGGKLRDGGEPTYVRQGKNLGKVNATNPATQAMRDALSMYNRQVKRAGVALVGEHAKSASQPMQWRPAPMLVNPLGKTRDSRLTPDVLQRGVTVQRKYNGVRLVACTPRCANADGRDPHQVTLYSRTGGDYLGMLSLREALGRLLAAMPEAWKSICAEKGRDPWLAVISKGGGCGRAYPELYIDGELYEHGKSLQHIQGQASSQAGGESLSMTVFDCFLPELTAAGIPVTSTTRQALLDRVFSIATAGGSDAAASLDQRVRRAENFPLSTSGGAAPDEITAKVHELARGFLQQGYEGAIVRKDDAPYKYGTNGTHCSHLMKIKPRFDAEFPIVGYSEGRKGRDVGAVIWVCQVPAPRSKTGSAEDFSVVPKNMTHADRRRLFRVLGTARPGGGTHFDSICGLDMTVEFPELSAKTGIPVQAKALGIRNYEPAPDRPGMGQDPIAHLLSLSL
jgi:hypothetical protein